MSAVPKTADAILVEGVILYESGNVYEALARWNQVIELEPDHTAATRYLDFVQGHFRITTKSSKRVVEAAQKQTSRELRGEDAKADKNTGNRGTAEYASGRQPMAEIAVEGHSQTGAYTPTPNDTAEVPRLASSPNRSTCAHTW